ncbi:MAG: hypothetical protein ACK5Q5_23900 [Planctomycetaceae bacterium]
MIGFVAQRCQGQGLYSHSLPWVVLPADMKVEMATVRSAPQAIVDQDPLERFDEPQEPPPRARLSGELLIA